MSKLTIKIEGMSCQHCKMALEKAIGQLEGVNSVKWIWRRHRFH